MRTSRSQLRGLLAVSAIVAVLVQPYQTALLAADPAPRSGNAAQTETARTAAPPPAQLEQPTVRLAFFNEPWPDILRKVAEETGAQLVMQKAPAGRLTRRDFRRYSRGDAVRILNHELEKSDFRILEQGNFLVVLHLDALRTQYRRAVLPTGNLSSAEVVNAGHVEAESEAAPHAPAAASAPASVPAGPRTIPIVVATHRRGARETGRIIYNGLKDRAGLLDGGSQGLPSFRVFENAHGASESPAQAATQLQVVAPGSRVRFVIGINTAREELIVQASEIDQQILTRLIQYIDSMGDRAASELRLVAYERDASQVTKNLRPALEMLAARNRPRPAQGQFPSLDEIRRPVPWDSTSGRAASSRLDVAWQQQPANQPAGPDDQPAPETPPTEGPLLQLEGLRGPVTIQEVPGIGMVVTGAEGDVETVVRIMRELERLAAGVEPDIHLLLLRHVNSEALAALLNDVYEDLTSIRSAGANQQPSAAIIPVMRPNAVLIVAGAGDLESIRALAEQLDQPVDPRTEIEVFALKTAVATDVLTTLESLYAQDDEPLGLLVRMRAVADARTNSIVVQASPRDLAEIALVIRKIDRDSSAAVNKLRVFPLKNAVADELAAVINTSIQSVLNPARPTTGIGQDGGQFGGPGAGPGGQSAELTAAKSVVLEFLTTGDGTERTVRSGLLADIRVTADPRVNSLIVTASDQSMPLIEALIQQLDAPSSNVAEIKVFQITNGDATAMAELLEDLFTSEDTQNQAGVEIVGAEDASSGLIPLRFSVDIRTNSVIAVGGAEALRVVEAVLLRLDEGDIRQRESTVVKLKNSPAVDVAAAINGFLQAQRELAQIDPDLVSNVELLEQEIIVEPEPVSNSLLISSTPRYREEILNIVRRLDEEPAQVIIQVLIVEVDLQNTDEFGVELGFQDSVLFDRGLLNLDNFLTITESVSNPGTGVVTTSQRIVNQEKVPGFLFNNQQLGNNNLVSPSTVGTQGLSNFSLGRINGDLGFGGLVLSASSESVSVLIRALAAQRNVHILSRPQIRTVDNQLAQIQVGQQVPVISGATTNNLGGITPVLGTPQQVGIILQVTPRITPDGVIVMETIANKSAISGQGVPILTDPTTGAVVESPIFDLTEARATVAVPDGQTVVLGGMITKSDDTLERKVPWLGDIPLLGQAFRYDSTSTRRAELLIFMTPRIIRNAADSELIKQVEAERMHFLQNEAEEIHGPLFAVPPETPFQFQPFPTLVPQHPEELLPAPVQESEIPTTIMPIQPPAPMPAPQGSIEPNGSGTPTNLNP